MLLDLGMVGDQPASDDAPDPLVEPQPGPLAAGPFFPLPFDAVHIDQELAPTYREQDRKYRSIVSEKQTYPGSGGCIPDTCIIVGNRVPGILVRYRNMPKRNPFEGRVIGCRITLFLTIYDDVPAAFLHIKRAMFCKRLETAVRRRYTSRAED